MQDVNKNFSEYLKACRKAKGFTQTDLSLQIGVAQTTVGNYETGRRLPERKTILKIAKALNVSAEELLKAAGIEEEPLEEETPPLTREEAEQKIRDNCERLNNEGVNNVLTVSEWLLTSNRFKRPKAE